MLATARTARPIEYSILHHTKPAGPLIGRFADQEFTEFVRDEFGRLFVYSGVAPRRSNGQFNDDALGPGEFIVRPGLIYRYKGKARQRA